MRDESDSTERTDRADRTERTETPDDRNDRDDRAGYVFTDDVTSDLAFVARGETLEELFEAAANALLSATLEAPGAVREIAHRSVRLEEPSLELLLLRFLNELVYLRDAEDLVLHARELEIECDRPCRLLARLAGEELDRERHHPHTEVKAATAHGLSVTRTERGWEATVTLDV